ncbi:IPExxxVDY family protein [Cesiribacter andamanensis]|uniref:IPExxxVDY family protein n=1 Tax=Cesiribacter andamanensis AMV16 TaxID=1279009 RepID=M7N2Z0_9BACT|nr:IPExxxVDY family protein [Cesiribacter andamanensis]EMR03048.1 hypothetical protein ADICEAN_01777 [Cesiribacter andamanensis AMV16]
MKRSRLQVDYEYDFTLWALLSPMREYKLAWYLNQLLHIRLVKEKDIAFAFTNQPDLSISNYIFATENCLLRLLRNRSVSEAEQAFLLPELKQFDYLLMLQGEGGLFDHLDLVAVLQKIPTVDFVKPIEVESLKSKENLIF